MVDTLHCKILVLYCDEKGLPCGRKQGKKTSTITLGRDHRGHLSAYVELDEVRLQSFATTNTVLPMSLTLFLSLSLSLLPIQ